MLSLILRAVAAASLAVATAHASSFVYVADKATNVVHVLDEAAGTWSAGIPVGTSPTGIAVSPDGSQVWVTNSGGAGTISVIDAATRTTIDTIAIGGNPNGIAFSPAGDRVYVAVPAQNQLRTLDTATATLVNSLLIPLRPHGVAVDADRVYVAKYEGNLTVVDRATNTVETTRSMTGSPLRVAVHPGSGDVYVVRRDDNMLTRIGPSTTATVIVPNGPVDVAIGHDGTRVLVVSQLAQSVSILDASSLAILATIPLPSAPESVAMHPVANLAYVITATEILAVDTAEETLVPVPAAPHTAPAAAGLFIAPADPPTITSAAYDLGSGVLTVTGKGFVPRAGVDNDIDASLFTITGVGGNTYTLTDTPDVDITSSTSFTLTLSANDRAAVAYLLARLGTSAADGTLYNLAAADDWARGAQAHLDIADPVNGINVTNGAATCYATSDSGTTVFASTDAMAVQQAITAGSAGSTVKIAGTCAGTQTLGGTVQAAYVPYAATLEGGYPIAGPGAASWTQPPDPAANPTILDAVGGGRVIRATASLTLRGLTVRNGSSTSAGGGVNTTADLTLEHVRVLDNQAATEGGGVYQAAGTLLMITASEFRGNRAGTFGAGFFTWQALQMSDSVVIGNVSGNSGGGGVAILPSTVARSEFRGNRAGGGSGGLYLQNGGTVSHSRFIDNEGTGGGAGAIFLEYAVGNLEVRDSLFSRNRSSVQGTAITTLGNTVIERSTFLGSGQAGLPAILVNGTGTAAIRNSIIANADIGIRQDGGATATQEYNLFHGNGANLAGTVGGGTGSLDGDPLFVDPSNDDLRLLPGSAAFNAGDPGYAGGGTDVAGDPRVAGGRLDIGAHEMPAYTVTASHGANGTISPAGARAVMEGGTAEFTVTPEPGYTAMVGGTCGGTLAGNLYTTSNITANCTVEATFTQNTYTVTPSHGPNGTITPATPQTIAHGDFAVFTVTPSPGYTAVVGGTCGGTLAGTTYTTNDITANCTVDATFTLNTYTVTSSAGPNGTISPLGPQPIAHGDAVVFTVTPDVGYVATVGGTCGGTLAGTTYTTNDITANCTVDATFAPSPVTTFTGPSATGTGMITASFTGGGPTCTFTHAQFIRVEGDAGSPPAGTAPANVEFPHGLFDFRLGGCTPGATVTMTITYPTALPQNTWYWKYGPTPSNAVPHWYVLAAGLSGTTISFTLTDGSLGDDDLVADGNIIDQGGPGTGPTGVAAQVPALSGWAMVLLAALLLLAGVRRAPARPGG